MADWEHLKELGHDIAPPPYDGLEGMARRRDRRLHVLLGAAAAVVVAGGIVTVATVGDRDRGLVQPAKDPTGAVTEPAEVATLPAPDPGASFATLQRGRYRVRLDATLAFDITVPSESFAHDNGTFIATGPVVVKTEVAGPRFGVPADPCGNSEIVRVGPDVDDLIAAIRSKPVYRATDPVPVHLGGADGFYFEISVPATYDASACGGAIHMPGTADTSVDLTLPASERVWILDVAGRRVVIQQNCTCSGGRLAKDAAVVRSINFVETPAG